MFERRIFHAILVICAGIMSAPHCARAQQSYEVIAQNGVAMKTRDGVTLRAVKKLVPVAALSRNSLLSAR